MASAALRDEFLICDHDRLINLFKMEALQPGWQARLVKNLTNHGINQNI